MGSPQLIKEMVRPEAIAGGRPVQRPPSYRALFYAGIVDGWELWVDWAQWFYHRRIVVYARSMGSGEWRRLDLGPAEEEEEDENLLG